MLQSFSKCFGCKTIMLDPEQYCYKLGKQCKICKQIILHRQAMSVCNCYVFTHRKCFVKMLQKLSLTQFTKLKCSVCKYNLQVNISEDYILKPKFTLKNTIITFLLLVFLILACAMLFKLEQIKSQQHNGMISFKQITVIAITTIFSIAFWISVMNILFTRVVTILQIKPTNIDIKISAFQSIQDQIKQDSQQEIFIKAHL